MRAKNREREAENQARLDLLESARTGAPAAPREPLPPMLYGGAVGSRSSTTSPRAMPEKAAAAGEKLEKTPSLQRVGGACA